MRWLASQGLVKGRAIDWGCGKGTDARLMDMEGFDPHWKPDLPRGLFDTVTCIYVTNTLPSRGARLQVEQDCLARLRSGGTAYLVVRDDVKDEGWRGPPGRRTWQGNVRAGHHWKLLKRRKGSFRIYERTK
jgi:hypothetical protein